jgi:DNA-directed RNA polymerase III subunit RPC1
VLLDDEERRPFARALRSPSGQEPLRRTAILKKVNERCKKVSECPWCSACNGLVKKAGCMKIVHEKYRDASHAEARTWRESFGGAVEQNSELAALVPKAADELNPLRVQALFRAVLDDDVLFLNMDGVNARPEQLLVSTLLVPPVCIRPSVLMDASVGSNEDDLTIKLSEIIHINNIIRNALEKGAPASTVMEDWDFLQIQVAMYFNSQVPGLPSTFDRKPIRSLCQRLKGKTGRFRGNLSGKRVDFSARTVISPDPNVGIHEVCIPVHVAQTLTYPERASAHNLSKLRTLILNGPDVHPRANYIEGLDGSKRSLKYGDRRRAASELKVGDTVERHLHDGDVVLFNRQPSLHKLSIMAHRARVMPSRTFRFNECVCAPYNADFDGDEMNVHLPQTEEARAEASELMGSMRNIVTPRNGEPIIAATQDFITGAYMLTRKNVFLTRDKFCQLAAYCADASEAVDLPPPALLKPLELWTG